MTKYQLWQEQPRSLSELLSGNHDQIIQTVINKFRTLDKWCILTFYFFSVPHTKNKIKLT